MRVVSGVPLVPHAPPKQARPPSVSKRFYTETELTQILGISRWALSQWIDKGLFPRPVRPGGPRGKKFWPVELVESKIAELAGRAS
jgi:predicted DNA-binding transcriptional regulator AlpA